ADECRLAVLVLSLFNPVIVMSCVSFYKHYRDEEPFISPYAALFLDIPLMYGFLFANASFGWGFLRTRNPVIALSPFWIPFIILIVALIVTCLPDTSAKYQKAVERIREDWHGGRPISGTCREIKTDSQTQEAEPQAHPGAGMDLRIAIANTNATLHQAMVKKLLADFTEYQRIHGKNAPLPVEFAVRKNEADQQKALVDKMIQDLSLEMVSYQSTVN
ncbi:MAG: hypothetical protein WBA09_21535, partial [Candidatus Acidiferrum sp.]